MTKTRLLVFAALVSAFFVSGKSSHAQAVYVEGTASRISNSASDNWVFGPTVGVYFDRGGALPAHIGLDARGQFLSKGSTSVKNFMIGPRISFVPHVVPFKIYGQAEIGFTNYSLSSSSNSDHTGFGYQLDAGLETTLLPHIDWRVIEFGYQNLSTRSTTYHPINLSTGLALRF